MADDNVVSLAAVSGIVPPDPDGLDVELGVANVLPGSAWLDWSGGQNAKQPGGQFLVGRDPLAPSTADLIQMGRRDGQARALLSLITLPMRVALSKGEWKAPEGEDSERPEIKFANDMWTLPARGGGMLISSTRLIRQMLLAVLYGFTCFEHVRTICEVKGSPLQGMMILEKLAFRDPRTIYFLCDDHGGFNGVRQIASFANRTVDVVMPADKVFYFTVNEEENPFYGISMFEPAYEHYQIKRKMYYITHIAAQFGAVPGRIGMLPPNPNKNQLDKFREALKNFSFNTSMMVPNGYDVKPFNGTSQFDFLKIIDHHNTMMASSVLAKFLQQEDRQVLIDNGKADASADLFVQSLESIILDLAEALTTQLMPQYIDANFSNPIYPVFTPAPLSDDQKSMIANVFESIVVAPTLNCTPEFVRQLEESLANQFGFDINYEEIAEREAEQAKQQAAQQAQEAAQQQAAQQASLQQAQTNPNGPQLPPPNGKSSVPQYGNPNSSPAQSLVAASNYEDPIDILIAQLSAIQAMEDDEVTDANPEDLL